MSEGTETYIIKKIKKVKGGHHGGAWKIAYADFITAMMAFFLLMWLLALMNKYQLQGFAEYFKKPMKTTFVHQGNNIEQNKNTVEQEKMKAILNKHKQEPLKNNFASTTEKALEMKKKLEDDLNANKELAPYKNLLNFVVTADGLKIVLRELENQPMFSNGKTDFQVYAKSMLSWLSKELNTYPNSIEIIGHTDAARYGNDDAYTNWELSADRANATRRALIENGMMDGKILRIIGVGDKDLLKKEDGLDPSNRRIEIVILSDEAVKNIVD